MRARALGVLGAVALLYLGGSEASAQYNPNGWIQTAGWNYLFPLGNPYGCGGGGTTMMAGNWVAPHDIGLEDPKAGDEWADIDFNGAALATNFNLGGLLPNPTWLSNAYIEGLLGLPAGSVPNGDVIDYQGLVDWANANLAPPSGIPGDNVVGIATTYVENLTGAPLQVGICTASDDSIAVYVNDGLVTNVSWCRGTAGDCNDLRSAVLPPGISKIATLVWEGGGGWGFRLAIEIDGVKLRDGDARVRFIGAGDATTVGNTVLTRALPDLPLPFRRTPSKFDRLQVVVKAAESAGADGDAAEVIEEIYAPSPELITIADVSNGGAVSDILLSAELPGGASPVGIFDDHRVVGSPACGAGSTTTYDGGTGEYNSIANTGKDIWDAGDPNNDGFEFAYARLVGDFDVAMKFTQKAWPGTGGRWGKFGLMARWDHSRAARYTMMQDHGPDLIDSCRLAGRLRHLHSGDMYEDGSAPESTDPAVQIHPTYLRLRRVGNILQGYYSNDAGVETDPIGGPWVRLGRDDNWAVGPDGRTVGAPSGLLVGFANSQHNSGGCGLQDLKFQIIGAQATKGDVIGKRITWNVTLADAKAGLGYKLGYGGTGETRHLAKLGNARVYGIVVWDGNQTGPIGVFDNALDVGNPCTAGSTTYDPGTGTYAIVGSGDDIWAGGDQFQFAYKALTGDFEIVAHIARRIDPAAGGRWGKHGLMARWNLENISRYSMMQTNLVTPGDVRDEPRMANRVAHRVMDYTREWWFVDDGAGLFPIEGRLPTWMKLLRRGNTIYTYLAEDDGTGTAPYKWVHIGVDSDPNTPQTILGGFALTSHAGCNTGQVDIDNVTIEALPPCPAEFCNAVDVLAGTDFEYPDGTDPAALGFTNVQGGDFRPVIAGGRLQVTNESTGGSANVVWFPTDGYNLADQGFVVDFDAYMTRANLDNPADGMAFSVLQGNTTDPWLYLAGKRGDGGGALALWGNELMWRAEGHPGFAVEIDNWLGGGEPGNEPDGTGSWQYPGKYHIGLDHSWNITSDPTNVQYTGDTDLPDIFAPTGVHFTVIYSAKGQVTVKVAANDGSYPERTVISACIPPLEGDVIFGFHGATGGATCTQEFDNVVVSSICCDPEVEAVSVSGPDTLYLGDEGTYEAQLTGVNGTATYKWTVSGPAEIVGADNQATVKIRGTDLGQVQLSVRASDGVCADVAAAEKAIEIQQQPGGLVKPGDMNKDAGLDISDPVAILNHLFLGGAAPYCGDGTIGDPANVALLDANGDSGIDLSDPVYLLNFLFLGGNKPANCEDETCPCIRVRGCPTVCP